VPIALARAVIDTSVVFIAIGLNYIQRAQPPEAKRQRLLGQLDDPGLRDREYRQRAYLELIGGIKAPLITSHVVGELQGLMSRFDVKGEELNYFWMHSVEFLLLKKFDERLVRLLDVTSVEWKWFGAIGPPDTGLIRLALTERCPLVTNDVRTLAGRARQAGVECLVPRELLATGPS